VNGVHDIGGMDGFGPIPRETEEPVFHEPWERRVFGMFLVGAGLPRPRFDDDRYRLERLDPLRYLSSSYYERWLAALESGLIQTGTLSQDEVEAKVRQLAVDADLPVPRREDPARADGIANALRAGHPAARKIRQKPRFAVGEKIVTRNLNPHGHTRLPRYTRGKRGVIVAHHGAHVFPDSNAHGLGENPQHLYTVRIAMRELWGDDAEPNESVLIDLWESYLEKDKAAAKSTTQKNLPAAKKVMAKTSPRAAKVQARVNFSRRSRAMPLPSVTARARGKKIAKAMAGRASTKRGRGSGKPMRRSR
jgi:nitrile hydratase subunit beta